MPKENQYSLPEECLADYQESGLAESSYFGKTIMLKRSIWFVLFLLTLTIVLIGWRWSRWSVLSGIQISDPQIVVTAPRVDTERLLADLENLTFERYTPSDRERVRRYITTSLEDAGWTPQQQIFATDAATDAGSGTAGGSGSFTASFAEGVNIYAERPGTDPNAGTIILAAHYDTVNRSPGADDNATSVATVLEAARLFGQTTARRTLQVVFFDLEEAGLIGSKAFVDRIVQKEKTQGAIVLDMMGYACRTAGCQSYPDLLPIDPPSDRGDFLAVLGDQGHRFLTNSFSIASQPGLPQVMTLSVPTFGGLAPDLVRSDHAPFWHRDIGAVLVTDTANFRNPHYHQSSDTLETIDAAFFSGAAQLVINATTALLQENTATIPIFDPAIGENTKSQLPLAPL